MVISCLTISLMQRVESDMLSLGWHFPLLWLRCVASCDLWSSTYPFSLVEYIWWYLYWICGFWLSDHSLGEWESGGTRATWISSIKAWEVCTTLVTAEYSGWTWCGDQVKHMNMAPSCSFRKWTNYDLTSEFAQSSHFFLQFQ